jgi:putative transposase
MPEYRRIYIPGGTFFFTVVTFNRQPIFSNIDACILLRKAIRYTIERHPFDEVAYCILPDHIHAIWTLPENDYDYPIRWRAIKGNFTRWYQEKHKPTEIINKSHFTRGEATIWQRRFWEHYIRDDNDFDNHMNYLHYNPLKHGLATRPADWQWSSFNIQVKEGYYAPDWGEADVPKIPDRIFGE